jgi:hypothetical protein
MQPTSHLPYEAYPDNSLAAAPLPGSANLPWLADPSGTAAAGAEAASSFLARCPHKVQRTNVVEIDMNASGGKPPSSAPSCICCPFSRPARADEPLIPHEVKCRNEGRCNSNPVSHLPAFAPPARPSPVPKFQRCLPAVGGLDCCFVILFGNA